jgi:hypothetical protein
MRPHPRSATRHSGLVSLAHLSAGLPVRGGDAVGVLLAAARPFDDGFAPLRPLWAEEAMHRAYGTLRLFAALREHETGRPGPEAIRELRLAMHLASALASLNVTGPSPLRACSGALREVARDLVALFGPAIGHVSLETDVEPLSLCAYRRRALVLLGSELVTNALLHAFAGRVGGRILLRLGRHAGGLAILSCEDDGVGLTGERPDAARSVAGALADLLEGDIVHRDALGRGTIAEVVFPAGGLGGCRAAA